MQQSWKIKVKHAIPQEVLNEVLLRFPVQCSHDLEGKLELVGRYVVTSGSDPGDHKMTFRISVARACLT